ncbi:MAG: peptide deformylase, partial [Candidatus Latescibacterota bacterium]|nr:peptide deformylase [Candidatus Latescibacterota bacterium]
MVREIVQYGSKILRRKADPVSEVDDDLRVLIRDLFDSLAEAEGVGLAAPQIG